MRPDAGKKTMQDPNRDAGMSANEPQPARDAGTIAQQLKNLNDTLNTLSDRAETLRTHLAPILTSERPSSEEKADTMPRRDCEIAETLGNLYSMAAHTLITINDTIERLDL